MYKKVLTPTINFLFYRKYELNFMYFKLTNYNIFHVTAVSNNLMKSFYIFITMIFIEFIRFIE